MPQFRLYIYNDVDLDNKLYPSNYIEDIIIDQRHYVDYYFNDLISKIEKIETNSKDRIVKITSFKEYILSFIRDVDFAMFISELKLHSNFTLVDNKSNTITPDQWDYEIDPLDNNIDENYRQITIKLYTDFKTTLRKDTNLTLYSAPNVVPVASNPQILGTGKVGNLTVFTYTYSDNDEDIEGTSLFQWFRYDNASRNNMQAISGATSQTYTVTTNEYNKYISCRVTPVAATGETPGIPVQSSLLKCETNSAPEAQSLSKDPSGSSRVGYEQTGSYVYFDADGDLEGATLEKWYVADSIVGENKVHVGSGATYTPTAADDNPPDHYLGYGVTPVATTGILVGEEVIIWSLIFSI